MKTEEEIRKRLADMEGTIKAGPDNDLQQSMWQSVLSAYETLRWVLSEPAKDSTPKGTP